MARKTQADALFEQQQRIRKYWTISKTYSLVSETFDYAFGTPFVVVVEIDANGNITEDGLRRLLRGYAQKGFDLYGNPPVGLSSWLQVRLSIVRVFLAGYSSYLQNPINLSSLRTWINQGIATTQPPFDGFSFNFYLAKYARLKLPKSH